jgi:hypothetical protein
MYPISYTGAMANCLKCNAMEAILVRSSMLPLKMIKCLFIFSDMLSSVQPRNENTILSVRMAIGMKIISYVSCSVCHILSLLVSYCMTMIVHV